jgi:hypothetical protein
MRNHIVLPLLLIATLGAGTASAQTMYAERRMDGFSGKNELSGQLGFQASLGGGTPGGFKMFFDYSHRMSNLVWLNFKLNPTFGAGETRTVCVDQFGNTYDCGTGFDGNGYAIDILAGVKLKWMIQRIHLMPYANANAGVVVRHAAHRPRRRDLVHHGPRLLLGPHRVLSRLQPRRRRRVHSLAC